MIIAAAICPHPPLLIPAVAAGAAPELDEVRAASVEAIRLLVATAPDMICVVGGGPDERWYAAGASGSFAPYGVPIDVTLGPIAEGGPPTLPLSLTVGAWLLRGNGWAGQCCAVSVPGTASDDDLSRVGAHLTQSAPTVGLLVMGDGSARRTEKAPGYVDPRATGFDATVVAALADAETPVLSSLDPALGAELMAAGTAPWRLLGQVAAGIAWDATVLSDTAPYGVSYVVANWARRR